MSYYNSYQTRLNNNGGSVRDATINNTKKVLARNFKESPSYYEIKLNDSITLTGVHINDDSKDKEQKLVVSPFDELKTGDLVEWKSDKWLTIATDMLETHWRGYIKKCESSLKRLNSEGFEREAYFTYKSSPTSSYALQDDKIMVLSKERRNIIIQSNVDTQQIKKEQRFIFDNRAWKVVGIDGLQTGLIYLTLEEDVIDAARDNLIDRVADYYNNQHVYTLEIDNGNTLSITEGSTVQLQVVVKDNGAIVDSPTLSFVSSDTSVATVNTSGLVSGLLSGTVTVTCSLANNITANDSVSITVAALPVDNYSIAITSTSTTPNEIKSGSNKTYTAVVSNNGTTVTKDCTFSLFADDGVSSTTLATITSQTATSCTVKNNNSTSGYVKLRCTLVDDTSVTAEIRIQMKPLF